MDSLVYRYSGDRRGRRTARGRRHVQHVHLLVCRMSLPVPVTSSRHGSFREDARLRQPRRALFQRSSVLQANTWATSRKPSPISLSSVRHITWIEPVRSGWPQLSLRRPRSRSERAPPAKRLLSLKRRTEPSTRLQSLAKKRADSHVWPHLQRFDTAHPCAAQSSDRATNRPGPHAIMPSAIAAQVTCTGQPSGTVSSTTRVITKRAHAASRVASPRTRRMGKRISAEPTRNATASGAGNEYGPPGKCNLNSVLKRKTAVSFQLQENRPIC